MGVGWWDDRGYCEFVGSVAEKATRTLEVGCGVSTVLLAAHGCEHVSLAPDLAERERVMTWCDDHGVDISRLTFGDIDRMADLAPGVDVFVGAHGYPMTGGDWVRAGMLLTDGGVIVADTATPFDADPRWERVAGHDGWRAHQPAPV